MPCPCHPNLEAGTGCQPGPPPTAWGSNLPEIRGHPPSPRCHDLPCLSPPSRRGENHRAAGRFPCSGTRAMLLGLGWLGAGGGEGRLPGHHLSRLAFPIALPVGRHQELPLWALRTALAKQFLKMPYAAHQLRCNRGSDLGGDLVGSSQALTCSAL